VSFVPNSDLTLSNDLKMEDSDVLSQLDSSANAGCRRSLLRPVPKSTASCLEFSRRQTKVCGRLNQDKVRINFRRLPLPLGRGYVALQRGMLDTRIIMSPDEAALIRL
jgi:hypothetical protein